MPPRRYESALRADGARATRTRIIRAAIDLAYERGDIEMTLEEVARRAETTVRTIMRQFGSRDALIEAGIEVGNAQVIAERSAPTGDRDRSIALLVEHYELRGAFVLRILASDLPGARRVTSSGRLLHREWVKGVFGADLPTDDAAREALTDMLVVATDVYAWKLLRHDRGLDAATTTDRIRTMSGAIVCGTR